MIAHSFRHFGSFRHSRERGNPGILLDLVTDDRNLRRPLSFLLMTNDQ